MKVVELWRYPVKSVGGESLHSAAVGEYGIDGDRRWGVFDVETGTVLTARRTPELLLASALVVEGEVRIVLPDGREVGTADGRVLSDWLDHRVELQAAGDEGGIYENPMNVEEESDWIQWQGPGGAWHDSPRTRVSLVSTGTIGDWDRRRFRANVIVDGAGEDGFVGGNVAIGTTVLDVTKRVDRCVMVTRPQPGIERDLDVLRTINRERDSCLAIGCLVDRGGTVAVGDEVVRVD
jgi:hypothetical protein